MKTIPLEEYVKEWKEFLEFRKKKIALNMEGQEYKEALENCKNSSYYNFKILNIFVEVYKHKGAYEETFEGMLSWLADGKPIDK